MRRPLDILLALTAWFAVITQLVLMMERTTVPLAETITRFVSYFTILTNTVVAVYFTCWYFAPQKKPRTLLKRSGSLTAITGYITVVGLVYQVALRHTWQPEGLQRVVDELLHSLIPVMVIVYWVLYEQKNELRWKNVFAFLVYPAVYLGFILLRGKRSGFYPYPFINVAELGWVQTGVNIVVLFGGFVIVFLLLTGTGKLWFRAGR